MTKLLTLILILLTPAVYAADSGLPENPVDAYNQGMLAGECKVLQLVGGWLRKDEGDRYADFLRQVAEADGYRDSLQHAMKCRDVKAAHQKLMQSLNKK